MAGNPREQWERLQVILQNRARRAGGGGAFRFGMPGGGGAPAAALAVLMLGGYALSQSLFNGRHLLGVDLGSVGADAVQSTVVTAPSSTPESVV